MAAEEGYFEDYRGTPVSGGYGAYEVVIGGRELGREQYQRQPYVDKPAGEALTAGPVMGELPMPMRELSAAIVGAAQLRAVQGHR